MKWPFQDVTVGADTSVVTWWTIVALLAFAFVGFLAFSGVRWAERLPKTPEGWLAAADDVSQRLRLAATEVADEIGAEDLAQRMRTDPSRTFPASEYLRELNQRQPGAGNRAYKIATKRRQGQG